MNLYVQAAIEACLNTVFPLFVEITAPAMLAFGGYEMPTATAAAAIGATLGGAFMWVLGRLASGSFKKAKPERFEKMHVWGNKNGLWLMFLVWLPIGFMLAFAAGAMRIPLRTCLPMMCIGCIFYYAYLFLI